MKSDESNILSELIDKHIQTIVNKVVFQIRRVPKEAMISGDDSGLKSHWDELCVQESNCIKIIIRILYLINKGKSL